MTEFDKLNLMVVPIFKEGSKIPGVEWTDRSTWCSWEEKEDVYPNAKAWYVLPSHLATYYINGVEVGYYVIDVDNHAGDKFKEAVEFLKKCGIPRSLTVRTPSGGLHIYYWAPVDSIPQQVVKNNPTGLPIEIKTKTGVVAPNGKDRVVEIDEPVAYLTATSNSLFSQVAKVKPTKQFRVRRKPVNPNYILPPPLALPESQRHDTMIKEAKRLQDDGCPDEKIIEWLKATRELSPGSRRITDREIDDMVDWEGSGVEYNYDDVDKLLEDALKQEAEAPKKTFADIFPEAEELTGWDAVFAKSVFVDKEETKKYIKEELKNVPKEDLPFVRDMLDPNKIRTAWASAPYETQVKYEMFKDSLKNLLQK